MAARVCAIFSCVTVVHFPGLIDCASHCVRIFVGCAISLTTDIPFFTRSLICLLFLRVFASYLSYLLLILCIFDVLMEEYICMCPFVSISYKDFSTSFQILQCNIHGMAREKEEEERERQSTSIEDGLRLCVWEGTANILVSVCPPTRGV